MEHTEELPVRPPAPFTRRLFTGTVTAEKPLTIKVEDEWFPGTEEYALTLAPFPDLQLAGSLRYLLQYPYGCLEQVTSKLFPSSTSTTWPGSPVATFSRAERRRLRAGRDRDDRKHEPAGREFPLLAGGGPSATAGVPSMPRISWWRRERPVMPWLTGF